MTADSTIFKAYDIRGTYPEQLDEEGVKAIGRAAVQILGAKKVVIGHDMRLSADSLYPGLRDGLVEAGVEVIDIGLCSTSMSYFGNIHFEAEASLMLTASHNPPEYNGFKICGADAQPFTTWAPTKDIEDRIQNIEDRRQRTEDGGRKGTTRTENILDEYVKWITEGIKIDGGKLGKIIVDAGNGMAGMVVPPILDKLGVKYEMLYRELDGSFPNHEPNPLKTHTLKALQDRVKETGASAGIAFDGDGDRIGFVDEEGAAIRGDMLTILIAKEMLKSRPGMKVMYDLRSSQAVGEEIRAAGGEAEICKVGHGLIKPVMRKNKVDFAGELSAHYFYKDLHYTDNGDKTLVLVLQMLAESGQKLSQLVKSFQRYYHSGEINFEVQDPAAKVKEIEGKVQGGERRHFDGLTVEFGDWWFNLRPSINEPLLRLNLEAKTAERRNEKLAELIKLIGTEPVREG